MHRTGWMMGLALLACGATSVSAADYPMHVHRYAYHRHSVRGYIGECVRTRVVEAGRPLANATPVIRYADGVVQEYDAGMLGHVETHRGDPIQLCLVSFSRDCGLDDLPGRTYATGNLRTGAAWTLPDIRSSCEAR